MNQRKGGSLDHGLQVSFLSILLLRCWGTLGAAAFEPRMQYIHNRAGWVVAWTQDNVTHAKAFYATQDEDKARREARGVELGLMDGWMDG